MKYYCKECGHELSHIEAILGSICDKCIRRFSRKMAKSNLLRRPPKGKKIA